ncbi:hypothetical protein AGDE_07585 [Angomonas deanei]|nr:hypothetical protein AGDE_07585 [Angomonas deanei]|eukprot:EPY35105.1 hypothetical protein AGDE_07585 [Angomonas deanei]
MVDIEPQMFKAAVQELGMTQSLNVEKSDCVRLFAMDAGDYILSDHPRPSSYEELTSNEKGTRVVFTNHPASEKKPLDLLFVDLFVGSEVSGHIGSSGFIADCRTALASQGVVVFNLPDKNKIFVKQCESIFGSCNVFTIPTPLSSNQIVVARRAQGTETGLTGRAPQLTHRQLYHRAKELEQTYRLPYDLANHFPVWWRFW